MSSSRFVMAAVIASLGLALGACAPAPYSGYGAYTAPLVYPVPDPYGWGYWTYNANYAPWSGGGSAWGPCYALPARHGVIYRRGFGRGYYRPSVYADGCWRR